jgi:hypothetical protein
MSTEDTLKNLTFFRDYNKHRDELVRLAKVVYSVAEHFVGSPPSQDECKQLYGGILYKSPFFQMLATKKMFLPANCYEACARLLAEYVVDRHWQEIKAP